MTDKSVTVCCYSDLLCVWAYIAELRLRELRAQFPDDVAIESRFVAVFGNTQTKIGFGWSERGGWEGYARHVHEVAAKFEQLAVHPEVWQANVAASSHGPHAFVKAAAVLESEGKIDAARHAEYDGRTTVEELAWRLRLAFFRDAREIGRLDVQRDVAAETGLAVDEIRVPLEDGRAFAALAADYDQATREQVTGSPTFVLNEGRQKLYGNVGYRILEANIEELLRNRGDIASWC